MLVAIAVKVLLFTPLAYPNAATAVLNEVKVFEFTPLAYAKLELENMLEEFDLSKAAQAAVFAKFESALAKTAVMFAVVDFEYAVFAISCTSFAAKV